MNANDRFSELLDDVIAAANDMAAELDLPADKQLVSSAVAILGLALSKLPLAEQEARLARIEQRLREDLARYSGCDTLRSSEVPMGTSIDGLTEAGARRLAGRIVRYWAKRGHQIEIRLEEVKADKGPVWIVRSNIGPAGLPPKQQNSRRSMTPEAA